MGTVSGICVRKTTTTDVNVNENANNSNKIENLFENLYAIRRNAKNYLETTTIIKYNNNNYDAMPSCHAIETYIKYWSSSDILLIFSFVHSADVRQQHPPSS